MRTVFTAQALLTPCEQVPDPVLVVEDGVVAEITSRSHSEIPPDVRHRNFPGALLAPGLVDIHIHGSAGHDFMTAQAGALEEAELFLARHGVTSYCPTTITAGTDAVLVALDRLAAAVESAPSRLRNGRVRAQPLGIHLEGPFLSHAKRGVHPAEHLQPPSLELFDRFWQVARGTIALMTVAPELPKAELLIAEAARRGVCVSLGHSDSTLAPVHAAIAAGARHVTHTFNAMRPLDHREPGILGAALTDPRLTADIIADGIHVHPDMVRLLLSAKGAERAVLISDAISAAGMGDGCYRLGQVDVEVLGQRCEAGGRLAGSLLTLDSAVRNFMQFVPCGLPAAMRLATLNPATVAGFAARKGRLVKDADADFVVLTPDGRLIQTFVGGTAAD